MSERRLSAGGENPFFLPSLTPHIVQFTCVCVQGQNLQLRGGHMVRQQPPKTHSAKSESVALYKDSNLDAAAKELQKRFNWSQ